MLAYGGTVPTAVASLPLYVPYSLTNLSKTLLLTAFYAYANVWLRYYHSAE